jgi:hypothetical protein
LIHADRARKEGVVNHYLLHEMARIKLEELRAEASRARAARKARGLRVRRHRLGMLAGSWSTRGEARSFPRRAVEEACCA